jgi:hypothetical protein
MTGNDRKRPEMTGNDRAVLNDRGKKLFYFSFFQKNKKLEFVSGQNKAFLRVTRKSVEENGFRH